jgi:hypothetical protein
MSLRLEKETRFTLTELLIDVAMQRNFSGDFNARKTSGRTAPEYLLISSP